jgi:hypothetical protein
MSHGGPLPSYPVPSTSDSAIVAGQFVIDLLTVRPSYRSQWERRCEQLGRGGPSQAAIARVISDHLIEHGVRAASQQLHRQIKDRVSRLFAGKPMSAETLEWIIDAFDFDPADAERVRALFDGVKTSGFVAGTWPPARTHPATTGLRTLSLHELHTLGPDGVPITHRTVQIVKAVASGVTRYLYRFDTSSADVAVVRGGRAGPVVDAGSGLHGVEIELTRPLALGETASLEYLTTFRYDHAPPPEFRRGIATSLDNLELRVQFHPDRLPDHVWWCAWPSLDGKPSYRQAADLDGEHAIHRYLDGIEATIVGFTWQWPDGHGRA